MAKPTGVKKVRHKLALPALPVNVENVPEVPEQRTARLVMRFLPSEKRMLEDVARSLGTTATNVVAHLVKQAWVGLLGKGK